MLGSKRRGTGQRRSSLAKENFSSELFGELSTRIQYSYTYFGYFRHWFLDKLCCSYCKSQRCAVKRLEKFHLHEKNI